MNEKIKAILTKYDLLDNNEICLHEQTENMQALNKASKQTKNQFEYIVLCLLFG